jgi:hypothetical protein
MLRISELKRETVVAKLRKLNDKFHKLVPLLTNYYYHRYYCNYYHHSDEIKKGQEYGMKDVDDIKC